MDSSTYRRPGAFSPAPSITSSRTRSQSQHQRTPSSESDSSSSSQLTTLSLNKRLGNQQQPSKARPVVLSSTSSNSSSTSLHTLSRPSIAHIVSDIPSRKNSPLNSVGERQRHRRQHSQGFFEPSLPTASLAEHSTMSNLTASQIAAQAAMQHQSSSQHVRKRSQTVPSPQSPPENTGSKPKPPPLQMQPPPRKASASGQYYNGLVGGHNAAAATAAAAAYPRSAPLSPGLTNFEQPAEKTKSEKSKMKLFSKPKHIGISSYKDAERKEKPLPSPIKATSPGPSTLSKATNASSISLVDPSSSAALLYSSNNASTSTLVPLDRQRTEDKEKEKDKAHRHNFLSRQKHKLKDKMEDHSIPLSSASSNSRPLDPHAPQSLYSFVPGSPGPSSTAFSKSVSGLDLRHGGRALREKKKEEKASVMPILESRRSDVDRADWVPSTNFASSASHSFHAPTSSHSTIGTAGSHVGDTTHINLQGFGLTNMTPEDAWDFLKAKLLIVFEGEELKITVEDLNRLVSAHIQRCVKKHAPTLLIEDLRDLLRTGFLSLEQTLRGIPDDRLVPCIVEMWLIVFGTILPYMQAVFLPLDLEFKGHGTMSSREAAEFWGVPPEDLDDPLSSELDVRRIVLISYRDHIILSRHGKLKAIFSRLSLENINAVSSDLGAGGSPSFPRPGTAGSLDPGLASFNSQSSTLLEGSVSGEARSRAVSNTSAPELPSFAPPPARVRHVQPDSSHVTETVGRMLQCLSVLASVQSGDEAQTKMEALGKELKLNWLGRGRTGRNRKGFVGTKVPSVPVTVVRGRSGED